MADTLDEAILREQRERAQPPPPPPRPKGDLLSDGALLDAAIYGSASASSSAYSRVVVEAEDEDEGDGASAGLGGRRALSLAHSILAEHARDGGGAAGADADRALFDQYREAGGIAHSRIADRESTDYKRRHRERMTLSPARGGDALAGGEQVRSYGELLAEQQLAREKAELVAKLKKQEQDSELLQRALAHAGASAASSSSSSSTSSSTYLSAAASSVDAGVAAVLKKRRRWDDAGGSAGSGTGAGAGAGPSLAASDATPVFPRALGADTELSRALARPGRWDETPVLRSGGALGADEDEGPGGRAVTRAAQAWETPGYGGGLGAPAASASAVPGRKRSRWDETPALASGGDLASVSARAMAATPSLAFLSLAAAASSSAPSYAGAAGTAMTPLLAAQQRAEAEVDERNRPFTDEELDATLPSKGFKIVEPPATYVPIRTPSRKLLATPTPQTQAGFSMAPTPERSAYGVPMTPGERAELGGGSLPFIKPEDVQFFGQLLDESVDEDSLSAEEQKERKIAKLLLKIKNGLPSVRKVALRQIAEHAREFGAGPLFNQILPLFMSPTMEDQERHLMVKVIDRVLFRLDDLVRPFVHKILVVIEPMLIDEDYYARVEGREIISNLAKAAGLATMIAVMRPDIDNADEYVRNTTSRAFAVVASALGIPALMPFLRAVCASKKTWQARHTGLKIVQQVAILMGCAVLPHLQLLVDITGPGLTDEQQKVRIMSALALAALAESAHPYGEESFDAVLKPLWKGIHQHRGKALAAFLKAVGFIIPIMKPTFANYYTREIMPIIVREFASPDEEMKKIVLKVVKQTCSHEGVSAAYVRDEVLPEFFRNFWVRRMALDRRNYRAVVETTAELGARVGCAEILRRVVGDLKDESQPYQRMVIECIDRLVQALGASDVEPRLEEQLVDGLLYAFQEQAGDVAAEAKVVLSGFATVIGALGVRSKPFLPQIAGTIKWRLNNKSPHVRMLAADLVARVAYVIKACGDDALLAHLGVCLYESLGEEFPDVLGAILGGLKGIVAVIGMSAMQPPIRDLLPRLTPILKNRNEKVQENAIDLVGRIADRGAALVAAREWMRISFELLELLKAPRKAIRRAAVNTFGYIAKAIGPQDVLHTLLNNLKVQERQNRVCTTVAIAIVAETCAPFTVLPALMNEYRAPDLNVQNGVLKSLSFMFEYVGSLAGDYVMAVAPLLEDALMDRDMVHRQTACAAVKHLALGLQGLGCEDALQHLLNLVWPNVLETSPHVIQAVLEAVEALRVSLGPQRLLAYVLQGLFHPARRVREVYWRIYNNLYVYSADALTPAYPRLLADEGGEGAEGGVGIVGEGSCAEQLDNPYRRTYLELFI